MRKRAGLARALALDPEIVFLDEPTAGLDPIGAAAFDELIRGLSHSLGLTVFLVTHDLDTLYAICDRIAVLAESGAGHRHDGRHAEGGSPLGAGIFPRAARPCGHRSARAKNGAEMETRANYVLIGAFTLAGLPDRGFFLWFAQLELDRQFAYYDVVFTPSRGCRTPRTCASPACRWGRWWTCASPRIATAPQRPGRGRRRDAGPHRQHRHDRIPGRHRRVLCRHQRGLARCAAAGTGRSGRCAADRTGPVGDPVPVRGCAAPARGIDQRDHRELSDLLNPENQDRIQRILINVEAASEDFAATLRSFSSVTETVSDFAEQIDRFNTTLEVLTGDLSEVLNTADNTLVSIGELSEQAKGFLDDGSGNAERGDGDV